MRGRTVTKEEILAMVPGDELDRLVAVEVMDLFCEYEPPYLGWSNREYWYDMDNRPVNVKPYSTDISAAWLVVITCPEMRITFHRTINPSLIEGSASLKKLPDGRIEWFYVVYEGQEVRTPEAPEAICKAALLAKLEVGE